jgi:hypothetical protein
LLRVEKNAFFRRLILSIREELLALEGEAGKKTDTQQLGAQAGLVGEWEQLATGDPSPPNRAGLAVSQARLGALHGQPGSRTTALRWFGHAVTLLTEVTDKQPEDCRFRQSLARVHAERARLLAQSDAPAAAQSARKAVELIEQLPADETAYLYDLACHRALLRSLLEPKDREAERLAALAVQALCKAVAAGYDNVHNLKTAPSLAGLRSRSDYSKVVQQAESNAKKDAP